MARFPEPGLQTPRAVAHSPDGKLVTFLQSESQGPRMSLHALDTTTRTISVLLRASDLLASTRPLSREEELRRERQRQRAEGITDYVWARRAPVMVIPLGGDVFVRRADGAITRLTESPEPEIDPKPCASGRTVAFVRGRELYAIDVDTGRETALTRSAPEGVTRGQSDFNGQEELDEPSGFWWAPGCDRVAYLEVDERGVGEEPILGHRKGRPDLMMQRYPLAGQKNPIVRVGVVELATRKTTWLRFPDAAERYFGRFTFAADGRSLWLQALSRDQRRVALVRADVATGAVREIVSNTSPAWVGFAQMRLLDRSPRLLWSREDGGHQHLFLHDAGTGAPTAQLTRGAWDVEHIEAIDEERGRVLFTGTKAGPLERHLYSVPLGGPVGGGPAAGAEPTKLTEERGYHAVTVAEGGQSWADVHSAADRLPRAVAHLADAASVDLPVGRDDDLEALRLRTPEMVTVRSPLGDPLYGALLRPRQMEPGRRYPAVVMVYGGPGIQTVTDRWAPRLLWQHLADRGFVVFQLDNHGSSRRGPAFESVIRGRLGEVELADQLAGADHLASLPFVDPDRMGIYGHSYGGFMAALAMLAAPGRFRAGISASPVTDWSLYDTGYTERYMGTPADNPAGYAASNLAARASALTGKLFVVHALMDENVHFQNTAALIDGLVAADKDFDLLVFPGERHGYRSPTARQYAMRRVVDYFAAEL